MRTRLPDAGDTTLGSGPSQDDSDLTEIIEVRDGESLVSGLVRKIAADWTRRYVGLLSLVVVVGLVVTTTPSRPPEPADAKSSVGWSSYQPSEPDSGVKPVQDLAVQTGQSPPTTSSPQRNVPSSSAPEAAPPLVAIPTGAPVDNSAPGVSPFDEPFPDFARCNTGESSSSMQLPIAQLLQVAGPILPLIGPITPLVLGLLPLLGPFLPKILPVIPMIQPFLDQISPAIVRATPSIVELENRLLEPLMPYIDKQMPKLLDAERELVAALEPQARRLAGLKESDCVGVTVAASSTKPEELISGDLARSASPVTVEGAAERVVTLVLRWSDPSELRDRIRQVAALDREDVMVRLVLDEAHSGDSNRATARTWVKQTIAALPTVSAWELSLPTSGATSNIDNGPSLLVSALAAALESRRVGQLVGIGLPFALAESSVVWGRLGDALPADARSRVNFLGVTVPGLSLSEDDKAHLLERIRAASAGFTHDPLPLALSVVAPSLDAPTAAQAWARAAGEYGTWLLSFELDGDSPGSRLRATNAAVPSLHRGARNENE